MYPCQKAYEYISNFDLTSIKKITKENELTTLMIKILEFKTENDQAFKGLDKNNQNYLLVETKSSRAIELIRERQQEIVGFQVFSKKNPLGNTDLDDILSQMEIIKTEIAFYDPRNEYTLNLKQEMKAGIENFKAIKNQHGEPKKAQLEELKTCLENFKKNADILGNYVFDNHMIKEDYFDFAGEKVPMSQWKFVILEPFINKLNNRILGISAAL